MPDDDVTPHQGIETKENERVGTPFAVATDDDVTPHQGIETHRATGPSSTGAASADDDVTPHQGIETSWSRFGENGAPGCRRRRHPAPGD